MKWYLMAWKKCIQFNGRSRRKEYWMFLLFSLLGILAIYLFAGVLFLLGPEGIGIFSSDRNFENIWFGMIGIYILVSIIPFVSVSVRRLHDINGSGWWLLIGLVPNVIFELVAINDFIEPFLPALNELHRSDKALLEQLILLVSVVCNLVLLVFMVYDSDTETNKYGPDPKFPKQLPATRET